MLAAPRRRSPTRPAGFAPTKRYWAVVGSGANKVAAEEVRIKLSELCYKSIACDVIEDKKHIDLSSEPLILVCAAGLAGSTADDVGKEVAIFRAHKATPIVIADDGDERYPAAARDRRAAGRPGARRSCCRRWPGHLFGYEAALAIDASARPLREAMEVIERRRRRRARRPTPCSTAVRGEHRAARRAVRRRPAQPTATTATSRRAPRCAWPGCCATCTSDRPVEEYQASTGKVGSPAALSTTSCSR